MAVLGLGTDIVEIARIEAQLARGGDRLAKRVLTEAEYARFQTLSESVRFLAKRFAAKEAAAKALGTGIGRGVSFQHIHISNNADGAPQLEFSDGARQRLETLGATRALLSIADERHYAVATVVLSD